MRAPLWSLPALLPPMARRTARLRMERLPAAQRSAVRALPPEVFAQWNLLAVASALMKLRGLDAADAQTRVRAGLMLQIAGGRAGTCPDLYALAGAAIEGERAALRRARSGF
jgi:hypothetical protein